VLDRVTPNEVYNLGAAELGQRVFQEDPMLTLQYVRGPETAAAVWTAIRVIVRRSLLPGVFLRNVSGRLARHPRTEDKAVLPAHADGAPRCTRTGSA